jgi:hypothetical protein
MKRALFCGLAILMCLPAWAQQTDINRYTIFTGFDYLVSPARNLTERGFDADFGVTARPWLGLGGDFSAMGDKFISGAGTINGNETVFVPLLTQFGIPPNSVFVPFKSTTYTFAVGPQFYFRKWKQITLFARPGLGGIHESATFALPPGLGPVFAMAGVTPPSPNQTDTAIFFGVGGGIDFNLSRPVALRFAADWVNTHLFSDLLTNRQNYLRLSVGPTFRWGHLQQ